MKIIFHLGVNSIFHVGVKIIFRRGVNSACLFQRSEGVILFSAEQFKSAVHDRVKGNCSTHAYGRTNAIEISKPDYRYIPNVYSNMMTRLGKGDLIIQHPVFKTLLKVQFPYPSYQQGK